MKINLVAILSCVNLLVVHGFADYEEYSRILFGHLADAINFPFLVKLVAEGNTCGGSIVGDRWVLTAAHCVAPRTCQNIEIYPVAWRPANGLRPRSCHVHPQYIQKSRDNRYDVSLVSTSGSLLEDGRAKPIPLPPPGHQFPPGTPAVIVGWGQTENAIYPDFLLTAPVTIADWDTCNLKFKERACGGDAACYNKAQIPHRDFCTQGGGPQAPGTCYGDSGGPVVVNGVLAGIVSFVLLLGDRCAVGYPSIHVNVADYIPWIYSISDPAIDTSQMAVHQEYY